MTRSAPALKVDVDTLRGTLEGVPRLLDLFERHGVQATFLFSLGPDHTGRALKRALRPGFFAKVQRTSVVEHYGIRTLLYGTLLPGPDIGAARRRRDARRRPARATRSASTRGTTCCGRTTCGIARRAGPGTQMAQAYERFPTIFGKPPPTHGAAGWQINDDALRQLDTWGMRLRVGRPRRRRRGRPRSRSGRSSAVARSTCVQIPTTLPTLDELIGIDGRDAIGAADVLLARTAARRRRRGLHAARRDSRG